MIILMQNVKRIWGFLEELQGYEMLLFIDLLESKVCDYFDAEYEENLGVFRGIVGI